MSDNPFLNRDAKNKTAHGLKSQKRVAKSLGGREQPGSGAMKGAKGDIQLEEFLLEAKATVGLSFSVKMGVLAKISKEALDVNKRPALVLSFTFNDGAGIPNGDWVIMRKVDFQELIGG